MMHAFIQRTPLSLFLRNKGVLFFDSNTDHTFESAVALRVAVTASLERS